jgi:type VI secretion system IcmF/VasK family protein
MKSSTVTPKRSFARWEVTNMMLGMLRKTLGPFGIIIGILFILLLARRRFHFLQVIPVWAILVAILIALVIWMVIVFLKWRAEKNQAEAIENGILDQAQVGADSASPARRSEIEELKKNLEEALVMLKKGPQGKQALYSLPWYMIIGPPAIGKTTAIINSGLNFPNMTTAKRMRGSGGTRNCDWWFSSDAILLDTAGRYAESADRTETETEWFAFLDLLKGNRKKGPINGLILGYSIEDLLQHDEMSLIDSARELRQRMDEILDRLGWTFPVYVLFTKCDLISGFTDYFSSLSPVERQQVWGAVYDLEPEGDQRAAERFSREFDLLVENLRNTRTRRMSGVSRSEDWGRVFMFPEEFANLKDKMVLFMETLFEANPYRKDLPLFRGTYYSSGKQLGKPFDLVVRKIQSMLGAGAATEETSEQEEKDDAYFVRDLFAKVFKSDRNLVQLTGESARRRARMAMYISAGFLGLSLLACLWIGFSYFRLQGRMDRARSVATEVRDQQSTGTLIEELEQLEKLRREITGSWRSFPLTVADNVKEAAQTIYLQAVADRILGPLEHRISRELENADDLNCAEVRRALRCELMLLMPERKNDIGWDAKDLAEGLSAYGLEGLRESEKAQKQLGDMTREFLELGQPIPASDREYALRRGGRRLSETHTPREFFRGIVYEASQTGVDRTLNLLVPDQQILQTDDTVRAAFTRAGWERSVFLQVKGVENTIRDDNKLITMSGAEPTAQAPSQQTLLEIYRDAFPEEWISFFESVHLGSYDSCDNLQDDLRKLRSLGTSPLLKLLREAADISSLESQVPLGNLPGMDQIAGIQSSMAPLRALCKPTDEAPAQIEAFATQLNMVYKQVDACANEDEFQLDEAVLREVDHWLDDFVDETGGNEIAASLKVIMKRPVDLAARVMGQTSLNTAHAGLQRNWSDHVLAFYQDKLSGAYPFAIGGDNADPLDVTDFFGSTGALAEFGKELEQSQATSFAGRRTARALQVAATIRRDMSMADKSFGAQFTLKALGIRSLGTATGDNNRSRIDKVVLTINGVPLVDRLVQTEKDFSWRTDDAELICSLVLESSRTREQVAEVSFDGTIWALCRLFEECNIIGTNENGRIVTWEFPDQGVSVEFLLTTREGVEPFFIPESMFRRFSLPEGVHQ